MHGEVVVALDMGVHDGHHLAAVAGEVRLHLHGVGEHALVPLRGEKEREEKTERGRKKGEKGKSAQSTVASNRFKGMESYE